MTTRANLKWDENYYSTYNVSLRKRIQHLTKSKKCDTGVQHFDKKQHCDEINV